MRRALGGILLLVGLAVMTTGLAFALQGYVEIIRQGVEDPLGEQATEPEPEKAQAREMLRWAIIGGSGAPVAFVGAILTFSAKRRRIRQKRLGA